MSSYQDEEFLENIDGTEGPLRKIRRRAMRRAIECVSDCCDKCGGRGDTPIERILFAALRSEISLGRHEHTVLLFPQRGTQLQPEYIEQWLGRDVEPLTVETQVELDGWRVDFLVSTRAGTDSREFLIVECDGHEFHERTKDQAAKDRARDREFQAKGYTVFRFTGSEIWRDPCGCADQIIDWAVDKAFC